VKDLNLSEALRIATTRAADNSRFIGYVLEIYREHEGLSEDQLADALGIEVVFLPRLYLCKRPDSAASDFGERVNAIADYALVEAPTLAAIIRLVDAIESLSHGPRYGSLLAAARDKEEDDDLKRPPKTEED
jgi:hypothetical protein